MSDPVVLRFGDRAFLVELGSVEAAHGVADALGDQLAGTTDGPGQAGNADPGGAGDAGGADPGVAGVVVGFGNVVVLLDRPDHAGDRLADRIRRVARTWSSGRSGALGPRGGGRREPVEIPVVFDGPDLGEVASAVGADVPELADLVVDRELEVAFVGFAPGFPYLTGLPPPLAALPRRPTPRPAVPAGSVAVAGGFASVYPRSTPGGWNLLGTTTTTMFDADRPPYALVRPGDRVRFVRPQSLPGAATAGPARPPGGRVPGAPADGPSRPPLRAAGGRWVEVVEPGLLSLVQDGGRHQVASLGVPGAGAADADSLVLANRLVGNPDGAAGVEITVLGPTMRFAADAHVAVVGTGPVEVTLDGRPCADATVVPVGAGQTLAIGRVVGGVRAYLAVAGGLDTPVLMGSRSSDLLSGLGPGALVAGDRLGLGVPGRPRGTLVGAPGPPGSAPREIGGRLLRMVAGPHRLDDGTWARLVGGRWRVAPSSNRIGVRLELADGRPAVSGDGPPTATASTGMVTGAVQLPPDGRPIILMPDHATVGGYPVVGCVITADLPITGQLAPGDRVGFTEVDQAGARRAWEERDRWLGGRVRGWYPTATGA